MRRTHQRVPKCRLTSHDAISGPHTDDLVFTTTEATPIDPSNLRRQFARLTEDAGLGTWHPHELRHSAASILSAAGVPLEHIADTLGHDGTRMTALVYRHAITPTITTPNIMGNILSNDASPKAPGPPDADRS